MEKTSLSVSQYLCETLNKLPKDFGQVLLAFLVAYIANIWQIEVIYSNISQ